jgi:MFS family permease
MGSTKPTPLKRTITQSGQLWHHPDFLKLWVGESLSLFGSQVTSVALPLTAVLLLSATPAQMGLLNAAGYAPYLMLTVFVGLWIDRVRRRPIMIIANIGQALLIGVIPLLAVLKVLTIEYLIAITFLAGMLKVVFHLAYQTFLPTLVEPEQLVEANSKLSASLSVAEIGGPGLAGLLVELVSAPFALLIDACSFVVAAASMYLIRKPESAPLPSRRRWTIKEEIGAGFHIIARNKYLIAFAGEAATYNFFWFVIQTVFLLYAINELGLSPMVVGFLFMGGSIGALLGSLLTQRWARQFGTGRTIVSTSVLGALSTLLIPLAQAEASSAVGILVVGLFLRGIGVAGCNVHVYSLTQLLTPEAFRGRVNASYLLITYGGIAFGALAGGFLGSRIGLWSTLLIGALGVSSSCLWMVLSPVRNIVDLPGVPASLNR